MDIGDERLTERHLCALHRDGIPGPGRVEGPLKASCIIAPWVQVVGLSGGEKLDKLLGGRS